MFSRSTLSRRAPEGGTGELAGNVLALGDLHVLVVKLEARMGVQEKKIAVLEQENSELWQEIHRLKGPRLPLEIFLLIVGSARDDKKALKTFSLVSKSWMHIAREVLFAKISLRGVKPLPFLNNPHCTIFPVIWAMPPAMRGRIKQLGIYNPDTPMFALTEFHIQLHEPYSTQMRGDVWGESGHLPSNILKWFTDRHPGGIKLFRPNDLQRTHPVEFRNFIRRFRASLLKTELSISNEDDIQIFVEAGDLSRNESATTWPEVDRTLAGTTFPALRNVTMAVIDSRDNEKHKQQMWKLLPLCIKKHILYGRRDGRG
ncbi:hypothetical protein B0H14DRAFT_3152284 [Mycena olivaceomarginata]|nr:hypothetical protein B0H14DRAFT_3152284 [Mycena olivaceomarginata]